MTLIAHISDVHLGPLPAFRLRDLSLKRLTGAVNWHRGRKHMHRPETLRLVIEDMRRHRPDHILVGGDLTNIGLPGEHAAARRWLEALGAPGDVTVVPGNHDVYVRLLRDPGIGRWAPWMTGDGASGHAGFPFVRRRGVAQIIALSSAVPTLPFMASGRLGAAQIEATARLLRKARAEGLARIVLIHHPPLPGLAKPTRGLDDAAAFAAMLAAEGAELVLFGHNHKAIRASIEGPEGAVPVIGVPSASAAPPLHHPPARWNLLRIERAGGRFRIEMTGRQVAPSGDRMVEAERVVLDEPPPDL